MAWATKTLALHADSMNMSKAPRSVTRSSGGASGPIESVRISTPSNTAYTSFKCYHFSNIFNLLYTIVLKNTWDVILYYYWGSITYFSAVYHWQSGWPGLSPLAWIGLTRFPQAFIWQPSPSRPKIGLSELAHRAWPGSTLMIWKILWQNLNGVRRQKILVQEINF